MSDMPSNDWTTDDTLTEDEIRSRMKSEGWEPVETLTRPLVVVNVPPRMWTSTNEASTDGLVLTHLPRELCAPGSR